MPTSQLPHPTPEQLEQFTSGRLDVVESGKIEQHLAQCESCCQLLKTLPDDTLVSLLRESDTAVEDNGAAESQFAATILPQSAHATIPPAAGQTVTPEADSTALGDVPAGLRDHPRYRVISLLGRGGMGSVYQAEHRMMKRSVALKVINPQLVQNSAAIERFHREVQAAAKLAHPNIVAAYDAEQAADAHFLVMEFVPGNDLAALVQQQGRLPVQTACEYVRLAALGLAHAHERGMVHRDIKPQNLMLTTGGQVKILDFGLAQFASEIAEVSGLTQMGAIMGTPDYMAPEQARDAHSADIRADIYSLGCTLYYLLTGSTPFTDNSALGKIIAHAQREPTPITQLNPGVPAALAGVIQKMMAKESAKRYQTPGEVAEALTTFTQARPRKAEAVAPAATRADRPPRSPVFISTAALATAAILAVLGVMIIVTDRGQIEIQSEVDDVDVVVKQGGKEIAVIDTQTGSQVKWLPSGKYDIELKGNHNDIEISKDGFKLTRFGKEVVTLTRKRVAEPKQMEEKVVDSLPGIRLQQVKGLPGHNTAYTCETQWSSDGKWFSTTNGDGTVFLWNAATGKLHHELQGHAQAVSHCRFLHDNLRIATASLDKTVRLWDIETGKELKVVGDYGAKICSFDVSPDNKQFLIGTDDNRLRRFNLDTGEFLNDFQKEGWLIWDVQFSPDGKQAVTGGLDWAVWLWDVEKGERTRKLGVHQDWAICVKFVGAGKQVLSGGRDGTAQLWDAEQGKEIRRWKADNVYVDGIAVSRDGKRGLISYGSLADQSKPGPELGHSVVLNLETGEVVYRLVGDSRGTVLGSFSPDGKWAITGAREDGIARLWRLAPPSSNEAHDAEKPFGKAWSWPQDAPPAAIAPFNAEQAKQHQGAWAKHLGVPVEYTNSIGMKFRLIPPGEFVMGSQQVEPGRQSQEMPRRDVVLTQPFCLGVHHVTVGQFKAFVTATGYVTGAEKSGGSFILKEGAWQLDRGASWKKPGYEPTDDHPVVCVSWDDAQAFCDWLSKVEGNQYSLPSEAQWEFGCRAGSRTAFHFGDDVKQLVEHAWYKENGGLTPHPVGKKKPNAWGLYDTHGNVWQWTADWWASLDETAPKIDPRGPVSGKDRTMRGGDWHLTWEHCRSANRNAGNYTIADVTLDHGMNKGFRVALIGERNAKTARVAISPFILLANDAKSERQFATLQEAVEAAQGRDTIEIRSDGPFHVAPLDIPKDKPLVLRAAAGARPVFKAKPASLSAETPFLIRSESALTLEGLEFHLQAAERFPFSTVLWATGGPLQVAHCRFVKSNCNRTIAVNKASLRATDCLFLTGPNSFENHVVVFAGSNTAITLENNIFLGGNAGVYFALPDADVKSCAITARRNTMLTGIPLVLGFEAKPRQKGLEIVAAENVFDGQISAVDIWIPQPFLTDNPAPSVAEVETLVAETIAWKGERNLLRPAAKLLTTSIPSNSPNQPLPGVKVLGDWSKFWSEGEKPSRHGDPQYLGGNSFTVRFAEFDSISPALFRLTQGSPGQGILAGGKDLGADVDLVGPGAAYEKWKGSPEYQEWFKQTGQVAGKSVETFVIVAQDAPSEQTFTTLLEAVAATKDHDTIEIRGNGPFVTDSVSTDNKALTIRAGKGFQPVLRFSPRGIDRNQSLLHATAPLVLEGLELQMVGMPSEAESPYLFQLVLVENAALHVANCRFAMSRKDGRDGGLLCLAAETCPAVTVRNCVDLGGSGLLLPRNSPPKSPLLVENCLLKGSYNIGLDVHQLRDVRISIRNNTFCGWSPCFLQLFPHAPQEVGLCEMEWIANIIATGGHVMIGQQIGKDAQPLSALEAETFVRRCLTWKDEKNVYSLPAGQPLLWWTINHGEFPSSQPRKTLAAWEQFWELKDTGSIQAKVRFKNDQALVQKVGLTPDDFRLVMGSPGQGVLPGGKDIGADIDLVGPGDAYEKWRNSPEYQEWLKALTP